MIIDILLFLLFITSTFFVVSKFIFPNSSLILRLAITVIGSTIPCLLPVGKYVGIGIVVFGIYIYLKSNNHSLNLIKYISVFTAIAILFLLGYKIPWFDKHLLWNEFPKHNNKNLVVEKIKDFETKYGDRYKTPEPKIATDKWMFTDYYKTNLKNIKSVDFTVTSNNFVLGDTFTPNLGGNSTGSNSGSYSTHFENWGIEYFKLFIFSQHSFFKIKKVAANNTDLCYFYQYNIPKSEKDTLFFNYFGQSYKAYSKN